LASVNSVSSARTGSITAAIRFGQVRCIVAPSGNDQGTASSHLQDRRAPCPEGMLRSACVAAPPTCGPRVETRGEGGALAWLARLRRRAGDLLSDGVQEPPSAAVVLAGVAFFGPGLPSLRLRPQRYSQRRGFGGARAVPPHAAIRSGRGPVRLLRRALQARIDGAEFRHVAHGRRLRHVLDLALAVD
jgi:hypothetical protein